MAQFSNAFRSEFFSLRSGRLAIAIFAIALALRLTSSSTASLSYLLVAAFALIGQKQALQALVYLWLLNMVNTGFAPPPSNASLLRYVVIGTVAISILPRNGLKFSLLSLATISLASIIIIHSAFISHVPDVSILKVVLWALVLVSSIQGWKRLPPLEQDNLFENYLSVLRFIMIASLPLVALPAGYFINGSGFQGILNQPQALGATMALLATLLIGKLFASENPSWLLVVEILICLPMILLTESRNAIFSLLMAISTGLLFSVLFRMQYLPKTVPGLRTMKFWVPLLIILLGLFAYWVNVEAWLSYILSKSGRASGSNLMELIESSRGILYLPMLDNISRYPWSGIGFGIDSNFEHFVPIRDSVFGIPLAASVEKGILYLAVLEELGIFVGSIVFLWMSLGLLRALHNGFIQVVFLTAVMVLNIAEATFFSPGGLGLLPLAMFGWAVAKSGRQSNHNE